MTFWRTLGALACVRFCVSCRLLANRLDTPPAGNETVRWGLGSGLGSAGLCGPGETGTSRFSILAYGNVRLLLCRDGMNWTGLGMREPIPVCIRGCWKWLLVPRGKTGALRERKKRRGRLLFGGYELGDGGYPSRSRSSPWGGRL
ncbi:hypothetical protein CI102_11589 [Trichoderma harzianum]|nr:hypothetical protein CI102_11589 [Trichoderma harzianum]